MELGYIKAQGGYVKGFSQYFPENRRPVLSKESLNSVVWARVASRLCFDSFAYLAYNTVYAWEYGKKNAVLGG